MLSAPTSEPCLLPNELSNLTQIQGRRVYGTSSQESPLLVARATLTLEYGHLHPNVESCGGQLLPSLQRVILWRSDLVHAIVAPSLTQNDYGNNIKVDHDRNKLFGYNGSREFGAVSYCSMLPVEAVKEYTLYSVPKHKMHKKMKR